MIICPIKSTLPVCQIRSKIFSDPCTAPRPQISRHIRSLDIEFTKKMTGRQRHTKLVCPGMLKLTKWRKREIHHLWDWLLWDRLKNKSQGVLTHILGIGYQLCLLWSILFLLYVAFKKNYDERSDGRTDVHIY